MKKKKKKKKKYKITDSKVKNKRIWNIRFVLEKIRFKNLSNVYIFNKHVVCEKVSLTLLRLHKRYILFTRFYEWKHYRKHDEILFVQLFI